MRRVRAAVAGIVLAAGLAIAALLVATWPKPLPELVPAGESGALALVVGESVDTGAARPLGASLAAHPSDPDRLFLGAAHDTDFGPGRPGVAGFVSGDGGLTWKPAFDRLPGSPEERLGAPALAFGPGGEVYLAHWRGVGKGVRTLSAGETGLPPPDRVTLDVAASPDGGATWEARPGLDSYLGGPRLAVDCSGGPNRGRVYLGASFGGRDAAFYTSSDGAKSFEPAKLRRLDAGFTTGPMLLPGGAVAAVSVAPTRNVLGPPDFRVLRSDDGSSFQEAAPVPTAARHARFESNTGLLDSPAAAADPTSGAVYCAWADGRSLDGRCVLFASSPDGGGTWAGPVVLSEQPLGADPAADWQASNPALAVNAKGVVAVAWYDRRGLPPNTAAGGVTTGGYNVRLRASLDGGRTWGKSVRVNTAAGAGDLGEVRAGLALTADAAGRFHAAWLSDAAGSMRLSTATVGVRAGGE